MGARADRRTPGRRLGFFYDVAEALCEVIRLRIRYDTKDENGETRRQRNARFGFPAPEIENVEGAEHFATWFDELSSGRQYGMDGPLPLSWSDMKAWADITGNIVRGEEWFVLKQMDRAYLNALAIEREDALERANAKKAAK